MAPAPEGPEEAAGPGGPEPGSGAEPGEGELPGPAAGRPPSGRRRIQLPSTGPRRIALPAQEPPAAPGARLLAGRAPRAVGVPGPAGVPGSAGAVAAAGGGDGPRGELAWRLTDRELDARLEEARHFRGPSPLRLARARLRADRGARWSLRFLKLVVAVCLLAPLLPLQSPVRIDLERSLAAPVPPWEAVRSAEAFEPLYWDLGPIDRTLVELRTSVFGGIQLASWLGTDALGRDLLSRLVWGSRTSLVVALFATAVSLLIGVGYGALAGLSGGRLDNLMMRAVDVLYSLPFVFLVIFVLSVLGAPTADGSRAAVDREAVLFVVIGAVWWLTMARVVRGQVLSIREAGYVRAALAQGARRLHVLRVHVLPGVLSVVVVYLTLTIPSILLFEAFLSFLGLGVEPPKVSWGRLVVDGVDAITPLKSFWWLVVFPAVAMGTVLLALNVLGDGLRDALDPRGPRASADRGGPTRGVAEVEA